MATPPFPFPPLRRELPRPDEYRFRADDATNEERSRSQRFDFWHSQWHFLYWIFRAANPRCLIGRTLERAPPARDNAHYVGSTYDFDRFRAHSGRALRRPFPAWRS